MERIGENFKLHPEAQEYQGYEYELEGLRYIGRYSKITPTKVGQFVTLWKRDKNGITTPMDKSDGFDFILVSCIDNKKRGCFKFPAQVMIDHGIMTAKSHPSLGKRGFRVYPAWDKPTSAQALKSQKWQLEYFSFDS